MIEVTIRIDDPKTAGGRILDASVQPPGSKVEAFCRGWGRNRDGSIRLDVDAIVTTAPGILEVMP
jgi:hypothetical protein